MRSLFILKRNYHNLFWYFFFFKQSIQTFGTEDGRETTELAESGKKHRSISSTKTLSGLTFHGLKAQHNIFTKKTLNTGFGKIVHMQTASSREERISSGEPPPAAPRSARRLSHILRQFIKKFQTKGKQKWQPRLIFISTGRHILQIRIF